MKRGLLAWAIAAALVLTGVAPPSAEAAQRPGAKCSKLGKVVTTKKHILICAPNGGKLVWRKMGFDYSPDSTTAPTETPADPVTAKIQRRLMELPVPNTAVSASPMRYIVESPLDEQWIPRLETQFLNLAQAYPEFAWTKQGVTIMPRTPAWLADTMRNLGCNETTINRTLNGFNEGSPIWGKGATDCNADLGPTAIIANTLPIGTMPDSVWDYMVAAEFTEVIRENRFALSPQPMNGAMPMRYYNVGMPSWMREGVEPAFHSIALAQQTRQWSFDRPDPRLTCGTETLRDYAGFTTAGDGCHYVLGYAANELMLALYGWDAPLLWWSSFGTQQDPYVAFTNAYGDDYDTFERYVREFVRYRAYGEPLSAELLARLA